MSYETVISARLIHYGFMNWKKNHKNGTPMQTNKLTRLKRGIIPHPLSYSPLPPGEGPAVRACRGGPVR